MPAGPGLNAEKIHTQNTPEQQICGAIRVLDTKTIEVRSRSIAVGCGGEMIFLKIIAYWFGGTFLLLGILCANVLRAEKGSRQKGRERRAQCKGS
jgi:hypothetical protein